VLETQGREFLLVILSDGTSQWDDHTGRRTLRHPRDQYLELWAFAGDAQAFRRLQNECLEFTISAPVPDQIVAKAVEMARQDSECHPSREGLHAIHKCVAQMDSLLIDYFWREINPLLSQPIHSRLH
jgi:hypothetical protein